MKKILATLGCVLLVAALALSAFAAFEGSTSALSAGAEYGRGETVAVDVTINSNGNNVAQAAGAVQFDDDVLEFVSGTRHIADTAVPEASAFKKQGTNTVGIVYLGGAVLNGKVFTLTFRVKDNAAFGETELQHQMLFGGTNAITATGATVKVVCRHDFTAENTAAKYEKAPATCTSQAEYYKSCTVCGEKGTETFFFGNKLYHDFTKEDTAAKYEKAPATCLVRAEYYKSCTVCGEKGTETFFSGNLAEHKFTAEVASNEYLKEPATCTSQAEYYKSCSVCGEKGTETFFSGNKPAHTFDQQKTEEKYLKKAAKCGQPAEYYYSCICGEKDTVNFFTYGTPGAHIYVEQDTDIQYLKSAASCTAKAVYYYSCECGANAKDEDPTRTFEFGEKEPHAFTKQDTAVEYLKAGATCTSKAVYYYSCNVCGEKGTTTFDYGEKLPHTDVEKVADEYLKSGATCLSEAIYYKSCSVCGTKNENATFKSGTKAEHSFISWTKVDENTHKSICEFEGCDEPKIENHAFDTALTVGADTHWNECVCGAKSNETAHVYDKTEWKKDADGHWHECECSAKADEAKHEWDEGKVTKEPDTKEEGEKTYTCKVCAQPKVEKLDKLATPKTDDNSMIVPFAVLLVLSACGVAAVLTLKKRSAI